jgi:hypothetical protein
VKARAGAPGWAGAGKGGARRRRGHARLPLGPLLVTEAQCAVQMQRPCKPKAARAPAPSHPPPAPLSILRPRRWSRRLVELVRRDGAGLRLRVEGPYPEAPAWAAQAGDDASVIVAGARIF